MRLVADANVLLSAVVGGRAGMLFDPPMIAEILTTEFTMGEVREYAPRLAAKRKLQPEKVMLAVDALLLTIMPRESYERKIPEAKRRIGKRDPDDVELLALALSSGGIIWSNDHDFADCGVECLTTAQLLKRLEQ